MKTIKLGLILKILVVLLAASWVAYYIYNDSIYVSPAEKEYEVVSSSNIGLPDGVSIEGDGNYTVEVVPIEDELSIPVPNLDRSIVFGSEIPVEAQDILRTNMQKISQDLKNDSSVFNNWIELGVHRKNIGDYVGAREAWDYAVFLRPLNSVVYHNLGDLYAYFIKDNLKAEQNFLKAIENAPKDAYLYFKISEFYKIVLQDMAKARAIAERGVESNPESVELKELLKSLK